MKSDEEDEIDKLLNGILTSYKSNKFDSLRDVFNNKISSLNLSQYQVEKSLSIERKTLNGILDGTTKKFDLINLVKIAKFLDFQVEDLVQRYVNEALFSARVYDAEIERKNFIINNFDLASLKKDKIIDSVADYRHIEKKLCEILGYDSILDYKNSRVNPAYSTIKKVENNRTKDLWVEAAYNNLKRINNFYPFDRKKLIDIFPSIRFFSTNVEKGLYSIIRALFKVGITVIYQPYLSKLQIRGATFSVNDKPCIVLTNYRKSYPSMFFCLLHELHHVLFDFEDIKVQTYHLSEEEDILEEKANSFAGEYLFSKEHLNEVSNSIDDAQYVSNYANRHQVHPSIIYDRYGYETGIWNRYKSYYPDIKLALNKIDVNTWHRPISETEKIRNEQIFNNI